MPTATFDRKIVIGKKGFDILNRELRKKPTKAEIDKSEKMSKEYHAALRRGERLLKTLRP